MQNVKGTADYLGAEQALRLGVQRELEELFRLYDYDAMETPMLNELSLLASKYAGGDEILREIYRLSDQGGRELGLRYDLTIPFAKVLAMNPGMPMPFKRYEMGKVFRDGPVKRGRMREFMQCDADVAGIEGPEAEAELMGLAADAFGLLGIEIELRWNNRKLLDELLSRIDVAEGDRLSVMLTLDKLAKIGAEGVRQELLDKAIGSAETEALLELIAGAPDESLTALCRRFAGLEQSIGFREAAELQRILEATELDRISRFDPFLSRGLSFYTGTVYEIFERSGSFTSSLGGGGRYDAIVGKLVGRDDVVCPAVGLSFGMESILEVLRSRVVASPVPEVLVLTLGRGLVAEGLNVAFTLRRAGLRTRLDASGRKLKKALAAASGEGIRFVLLLGEREATLGKVRLKEMATQEEQDLSVGEAVYRIEHNRMGKE